MYLNLKRKKKIKILNMMVLEIKEESCMQIDKIQVMYHQKENLFPKDKKMLLPKNKD